MWGKKQKVFLAGGIGTALAVCGVGLAIFLLNREPRFYQSQFKREIVERHLADANSPSLDQWQKPESGGRCTACHLGVVTAAFETASAPFRTHSALKAWLGSESPHPLKKIQCVACHQGNERARDFSGAGHVPNSEAQEVAWKKKYGWKPVSQGVAPMTPLSFTEANCRSCHGQREYLPWTRQLTRGMQNLLRANCLACHVSPSFGGLRPWAPSLDRIGSKMSVQAIAQYLLDPRKYSPHSLMPQVLSPSPGVAETEAVAIAEYLSASSQPFPVSHSGKPGDEASGKALFQSMGCLGCHAHSVFPRVGRGLAPAPDLTTLGSKVSAAWLTTYLAAPEKYEAHSRMPNFRLSETEIADLGAFLIGENKTSGEGPSKQSEPPPLEKIQQGKKLSEKLGCFQCHSTNRETLVSATLVRNGERWKETLQGLHGHPRYELDPPNSQSMQVAYLSLLRDKKLSSVTEVMPQSEGVRTLHRYQCQSCHLAEKLAFTLPGDDPDYEKTEREKYETEGTLMARYSDDEAHAPPSLIGEGKRVQPNWLAQFLAHPEPLRRSLKVRMPTFDFSADERKALLNFFNSQDKGGEKKELPLLEAEEKAAQTLLNRFQCGSCHWMTSSHSASLSKEEEETLGLAPPLTNLKRRLRGNWVRHWLRHPEEVIAGSRMPAFWPEDQSSIREVLEGDSGKQIDVVTRFLLVDKP